MTLHKLQFNTFYHEATYPTRNLKRMIIHSPASLVYYARFSKVKSHSRSRSRNLPVFYGRWRGKLAGARQMIDS